MNVWRVEQCLYTLYLYPHAIGSYCLCSYCLCWSVLFFVINRKLGHRMGGTRMHIANKYRKSYSVHPQFGEVSVQKNTYMYSSLSSSYGFAIIGSINIECAFWVTLHIRLFVLSIIDMDKLANTGRCQVNSSPPRMMHFSDFSIDHILNRAGRLSTSQQHQQTEPVESSQFLITNVNIAKNQDGADKALSDFCQLHKPLDRDDNSILPESYRMLNWLQYTRYYPRRSQSEF